MVALRHDGRLTYAYNYASLEIFKVVELQDDRGDPIGLFWIRDF